jgi:hypothetical protein
MKHALPLLSGAFVALLSLAHPVSGQTSPPVGSATPMATATPIPPPAPRMRQVQIMSRINGQWKPANVLVLRNPQQQFPQPIPVSARVVARWSLDPTASSGTGTVQLTTDGTVLWTGADGTVSPVTARLRLSRQGKTLYQRAITGSRSGTSIVFLAPVTFHNPAWDGRLTASVEIRLGSSRANGSHGFVLAGPARLIISGCVLPSQSRCAVSVAGRGFVPHEAVQLYRRIILALEPRGTQPARIHCSTRQRDGCNRATTYEYGNFGPRSFWYTAPRCAYGVMFTYWAMEAMGDRAETPISRVHGDPGPSGCSS